MWPWLWRQNPAEEQDLDAVLCYPWMQDQHWWIFQRMCWLGAHKLLK